MLPFDKILAKFDNGLYQTINTRTVVYYFIVNKKKIKQKLPYQYTCICVLGIFVSAHEHKVHSWAPKRTQVAELQIRRGNRDNLGIICHISTSKHIL